MLTFSTARAEDKNQCRWPPTNEPESTNHKAELTGLPVLLVLPVESVHSFQQLPLLAAAGIVDEVPGEDLLELADGEVFYRLLVVQIRQRRSDPPLRRRTDLQPKEHTESHTDPASESIPYTCTLTRLYFYLQDIFSWLQVQQRGG